jgi:hypothetical protein
MRHWSAGLTREPTRVNMRQLIHAAADVTIHLVCPAGEFFAGGLGFWVLGAKHQLDDRKQRGVLVAGPGRIPCRSCPAGKAGAVGEGVGVLGAGDPLSSRQQRGELVAGAGRIARLAGPVGEVGAVDQSLGCS